MIQVALPRDPTKVDCCQILLAIKMVAAPGTIPLSSIAVMDQTINTFNSIVWSLMGDDTSIADIFMRVKAMYEVDQIVNKVQDGTERYPQEENKGKAMKVEFRCAASCPSDRLTSN